MLLETLVSSVYAKYPTMICIHKLHTSIGEYILCNKRCFRSREVWCVDGLVRTTSIPYLLILFILLVVVLLLIRLRRKYGSR